MNIQLISQNIEDNQLQQAHALHQSAHVTPWSFNTFCESTQKTYCCWVVTHNGIVHGYAIVQCIADEATLTDITVSSSQRGKGLGKALVQHLISHCENTGVEKLWLEVRASNTPAKALYASLGFEQISTRKDYYATELGWEDAVIMGLSLSQ